MAECSGRLEHILFACGFFNVGEGNNIQFWHVRWAGDLPLKLLFPNLFECSAEKDVFISDVLDSQPDGEARNWNLRFHWAFHDWEMDVVFSFFDFIYSWVPGGRGE